MIIINILLIITNFLASRIILEIDAHLYFINWLINKTHKNTFALISMILFISYLLSLATPNSVTVLAMIPIIGCIVNSIKAPDNKKKLITLLSLAVIYGANIGGMGSITGSPSNLLFLGFNEINQIPGRDYFNFFSWFLFGIPLSLLFLILANGLFFLFEKKDIYSIQLESFTPPIPKQKKSSFKFGVFICFFNMIFFFIISGIAHYYKNMENEIRTTAIVYSILFILVILILPAGFKKKKNFIHQSFTNLIFNFGFIALFPLFFITESFREISNRHSIKAPYILGRIDYLYSKFNLFFHQCRGKNGKNNFSKKNPFVPVNSLLSASKVIFSLPYYGMFAAFILTIAVIFFIQIGDNPDTELVDGYFIKWLTASVEKLSLKNIPQFTLLLSAVILSIFATEFISNTTVALSLFPIGIALGQTAKIHPLIFNLGISFASTCAFMSPLASSVNAIGFAGIQGVSLKKMIKIGFFLNILGALLMTLFLDYHIPLLMK